MSTHLKPFLPPDETACRRRAAWRQRLIDAERGITLGFRGDSTFFIHFFIATVVFSAAMVLGFSYVEWCMIILAMTLVLSAEMFNQVLKTLTKGAERFLGDESRKALRIGTGAVFVTMFGAIATVVLVFGKHILEMFAE